MRLLRSLLSWGLCPQTPGIYRFFPARMELIGFFSGGQDQPVPPPFRPLSRSLGLLPSRALSRPTQVLPLLTLFPPSPIENQRGVYFSGLSQVFVSQPRGALHT
jgi:hypothetical protein